MANRNFASGGKIYSMHVMPVLLDCNFVVDSTNGNGLGIRNLKGPGISAVYMHTSSTPAPGNPNPAPGTIVVQLSDSYNRYFGGFSGQEGPLGSSVTAPSGAGAPVVITSLGTATPAQWVAAGVPASITPAVGVSFIAANGSTIGGGVTVAPPTYSGIDHIELVGDPNLSIQSTATGINQLIFNCLNAGTVTAPANGSVISLSFYLSNSSILIQGE